MKCNGAEILINCLKEQGVDTIFGYRAAPCSIFTTHSTATAPSATSSPRTSRARRTRQTAMRASRGASAYASQRAARRHQPCDGHCDRLHGFRPRRRHHGERRPQHARTRFLPGDRHHRITMPITKHNFIIKDVKDLAPAIRQAFRIANSGRKGPVLIDILKTCRSRRRTTNRTRPKS